MHTLEAGILSSSRIYFVNASLFARDALFWVQHVGIFDCDDSYEVMRQRWHENSFLLFMIDSGCMEFAYRGQIFTAEAGDMVLLDCKEPHRYAALSDMHFRFFHFSGASSQQYFDLLYQTSGALLTGGVKPATDNIFSSILRLVQAPVQNEHKLSVYLHFMLSEMIEASRMDAPVASEAVERAIRYMEAHIIDNISMAQLATQVNLSTFYFSRCFKQHTGLTPHQYYANLRLQHAKYLLVTSYSSIEIVAAACGFDSPSNFIRAFKKDTGMTPATFRKTQF